MAGTIDNETDFVFNGGSLECSARAVADLIFEQAKSWSQDGFRPNSSTSGIWT